MPCSNARVKHVFMLSVAISVSCVAPNPDYVDPDEEFSARFVDAQPKRIFVSTGMLSGQYVSDTMCQAIAAQGSLGGRWVGWYSSQTATTLDAIKRVKEVGPWYDLRGNLIFRNIADLAARPLFPLRVTEQNRVLTGNEPIWTGTRPGGIHSLNVCLDANRGRVWGTAQSTVSGDVGLVGSVDYDWTYARAQPCDQDAHLICIEQ